MATKIFVNLAVKDINKSISFFSLLGFTFDPQFRDDNASCMILGDNIFVMLIEEQRFLDFTKKEICDATKYTEVLVAIDVESRLRVDEMVRKAVLAGGSIYREPEDHDWMYGHSFADLDGHQWEIIYADAAALYKKQNEDE